MINCTSSCYVKYNSLNFNPKQLEFNAKSLELNSADMSIGSLQILAKSGHQQINHIKFEELVNITVQKGDVIIQSSQEFMIDFTHS